jgi:hypothetical protein
MKEVRIGFVEMEPLLEDRLIKSPWRAFAASAAEGWKLNPVEGFLTMKGQPIPRNADRPVLWQRC